MHYVCLFLYYFRIYWEKLQEYFPNHFIGTGPIDYDSCKSEIEANIERMSSEDDWSFESYRRFLANRRIRGETDFGTPVLLYIREHLEMVPFFLTDIRCKYEKDDPYEKMINHFNIEPYSEDSCW